MQNSQAVQCLLIDDEPIARRVLRNHLMKVAGFAVAGEYGSALACFQQLQQQPIDLLFLDIQMPQLNGLDFLRSLYQPPRVIIVSAHREYALEGFELDVVDYLLKPVAFERFLKALDKYRQLGSRTASQEIAQLEQEAASDHLFIRADRKTVKLVLAEVLYIESMSDYLKIHTTRGLLLTKEKISVFEQQLPHHFIRIHRSYILNTHHLKAYTHDSVDVDGQQLPISRSLRQEVLEKLGRQS